MCLPVELPQLASLKVLTYKATLLLALALVEEVGGTPGPGLLLRSGTNITDYKNTQAIRSICMNDYSLKDRNLDSNTRDLIPE